MPQWVMFILMVVTGVGMAGVGMNVMHDSNHDSFSSKKWVNKLMGSSIYILSRKCLQLESTTQCLTPYIYQCKRS